MSHEAERTSRASPVQRALWILRALSDPQVRRLSDVARATGLDPATASRLLELLVAEGFVTRDSSRRFGIGPEIFQLADVAQRRVDLRALARPSLERLVEEFEDTAVLTLASRGESVVADIELGTFPIRANYVEIGTRRPLGVGAGSLAVLAWMPEAERTARTPLGKAQRTRYPRLTAEVIGEQVEAARARGHALFLDWVVDKMGGIAVPLLDYEGRPLGALSVAALSERILSREAKMARRLKEEARRITGAWARRALGD
ncbi:IclR family transcriptional regulator [Cupriavidus basilensis]|uniref:IclR family transcriptional regulator n=1 Tax=Cupriavidus basilensis TaxID=68895 RepID=UPI00284BA102|nr:IclR family transcriptional regulator [Cupriavidus basilensis]MDR3382245.1 IclR family transcriptional regulator [Cupriavidus basilensis]